MSSTTGTPETRFVTVNWNADALGGGASQALIPIAGFVGDLAVTWVVSPGSGDREVIDQAGGRLQSGYDQPSVRHHQAVSCIDNHPGDVATI